MYCKRLYTAIQEMLTLRKFRFLKTSVVELDSIIELKKIFAWDLDGIIDGPQIYNSKSLCDINERRLRDAEVLSTVCRNINTGNMLEIGTGRGQATALMAINAPEARIYTVNIPSREILNGQGGRLTTMSLEKEEIGSYYKKRHLKNITQIITNSATWQPNMEAIQVAFIDGCHDTKFVYNDTQKVLKYTKPGSFVLWHDFNPKLVNIYNWIYEVYLGIEYLYRRHLIKGKIFHVRDSWTGVYKVP